MFTCKSECFCKEEFTYLQNSFKRNVPTIYSQFPLISHLIISCEHINDTFLVTPTVIKISSQKTDPDWFIDPLTTEELWRQNYA